jgi:hypothetical protein
MKTLKLIFTQGVDLLFAGVTLGLLIWHLINPEKNFTTYLWVVFGYVINVIRNKVIIAGKME